MDKNKTDKWCIFEKKICQYAENCGPAFECKAPSDEDMKCKIDSSEVSTGVNDWDIFKDRVESLLERWDKFYRRHTPGVIPTQSIKGFLAEVNDDFTKKLIDK